MSSATELAPAHTTSAVASAIIGPAIGRPDSEIGRWERASLAQFDSLAKQKGTYGHGGSGVTLPWGSAFRAAELLLAG